MIMHNNLVQTPVKKDQINRILHLINKGLCRPVTYSYYFEGVFEETKQIGSNYFIGYIPLATKLNPTIVYEIVARGRTPNDDNQMLFYNETPIATSLGTIQPFCVLHGVADVPAGSNNSNGYSSRGQNPLMEIFPGSVVVEKPEFSSTAIAAVNALSQGDPWHLDIGITITPPYANVSPSVDSYKGDFQAPQPFWPPFVLNVTVYYEQGIVI